MLNLDLDTEVQITFSKKDGSICVVDGKLHSISATRDYYDTYSIRSSIPLRTFTGYDVTLEFSCPELTLFKSKEGMDVSKKRVRDCSIEELAFAIREKLKNKEY